MAKEAKARGISVDDLLKKEVDEKVKPPTKEAVDVVFEQYKAQLRGQTREQAGPRSRSSCTSGTRGCAARPSDASFSTRPE
jgi:hypothetical protein